MAEKGKQATPAVAVYTKAELIQNAAELNTTPEILAGALVSVKKDSITIKEATDAVKAYERRVIGKE